MRVASPGVPVLGCLSWGARRAGDVRWRSARDPQAAAPPQPPTGPRTGCPAGAEGEAPARQTPALPSRAADDREHGLQKQAACPALPQHIPPPPLAQLLAAGRRQARAPRAVFGRLRAGGRAAGGGHARRLRNGDGSHHEPHPRRPTLHGQRRLPARPARFYFPVPLLFTSCALLGRGVCLRGAAPAC